MKEFQSGQLVKHSETGRFGVVEGVIDDSLTVIGHLQDSEAIEYGRGDRLMQDGWQVQSDWDFNAEFKLNPGDEVAVNQFSGKDANWGYIAGSDPYEGFSASHDEYDSPVFIGVTARAEGLACNRASHVNLTGWDEVKGWEESEWSE